MKNIIILLFTLLEVLQVYSQNTFQITYGGTNEDYLIEAEQTLDGYILAGFTKSFGYGNNDYYLIKTDTKGNINWSKTYGSTDDDQCFGVLPTHDGGFVLSGHTKGFGSSGYDALVIKTDSVGQVQWTRKIGGFLDDFSITLAGTNGYVLVGSTKSYGSGASDVLLCKLDSLGTVLWTKTIGGNSYEWGINCTATDDGGVIVTGMTFGYGAGNYDIYVVKTDVDGNAQWIKTYGGTNRDDGRHIVQTNDGGYIMAAWSQSYGAGGYDVLLIKTDANGNVLWSKVHGGITDDYVETVEQTSDGGYVINGNTSGSGAGGSDAFSLKTDSVGNIEWARTFGGAGTEISNKLIITTDGGYAIAARTNSFGAGNFDFYFLKTDTNGNSGCNESSITNFITNTPVLVVSTGGVAIDANPTITEPVPLTTTPATIRTVLCETCLLPDAAGAISGSETVCSYDTAFYAMAPVNGATSYNWTAPIDATIISGQGTVTITVVFGTNSGNISVTPSNSCGNSSSGTLAITVNPIPIAEAGDEQTVCAGESVTLTATGGVLYQWDNGVTNGVPFVPAATTTYSVTVIDNNGCSATDDVVVTVNPLPIAEAGNNQAVCAGGSVTLTATGGTLYQWDNGITNSEPFVPTATTTYTVTVTDNNGCTATDDVIVTVNPLPVAEAGSDTTILAGQSIQIGSNPVVGYTYSWQPSVGLNDSAIANPVASPTSTTYTL